MLQANVLETKNSLSSFLRLLESGQEDCVVIARHNKPVARIVPIQEVEPTNRIGVARAEQLYTDDWDSEATNEEVAALFGALA